MTKILCQILCRHRRAVRTPIEDPRASDRHLQATDVFDNAQLHLSLGSRDRVLLGSDRSLQWFPLGETMGHPDVDYEGWI